MSIGTKTRLKPVPTIVASVALFVILDLLILALNFHTARQIDEDSLAINLAGRQRMLSQQLARLALEQRFVDPDTARWQALEQQFQQSRHLFDATLQGFIHGGIVMDSGGQPAKLRARQDPVVEPILTIAETQWQGYQRHLAFLKQADNVSAVALANSDQLLATVNRLTTVLEYQAREKAARLRTYQSIAVIVVLINFAIILWQVRRRFENVANSNAMLRNLVDKMSTAVLLFATDDTIRYANKAAGILFGCTPDELINKTRDDVFLSQDDSLLGERKDGSRFTAHMELSELTFEGDPVKVITITDISHHNEHNAHWRHLAYHDSLTGLPNRLLFEHRVKQDLSAARRHAEFIALLTIDLDNFKLINDSYGHLIGDDVLRTFSQRLRDHVRTEDLVARLGGDEFVIVLTRFSSESQARKTAQNICSVLMDVMSQPVVTVAGDIVASGSIGVSFYPTDGEHLIDIMHQSDASMYRAKAQGLGCEILSASA